MLNNEKRDWNKIVADSNGTASFLSEKFLKTAEKWVELRKDYNDFVLVMAKKELTLNMMLNNLLFDVRKDLETRGREDIYLKDLGFNSDALDDGKFIINLYEAPQSQIPRR